MKLNNMGKGNIYNVSVAVDGDMINSVDTVVGNLDKGANTTVDLSLKGTTAAAGDINVKITYEDSVGEQYTVEKQMKLSVVEPAPVELATEEAATMNLVPIAVVAIIGIVVIVVVVNIIRKVREKKYA